MGRVAGAAVRRRERRVFIAVAPLCAAMLGFVVLGTTAARAVDGMWLASPATPNWNTGTNWSSSPSVPDGTASFGASNTTSLTFSATTTSIGTIQFNAGAPAYTFTLTTTPLLIPQLIVNGQGIVNNSSNPPTFILNNPAVAGDPNMLTFQNAATAGNANVIANGGATGAP